jgi:hypothetical protein
LAGHVSVNILAINFSLEYIGFSSGMFGSFLFVRASEPPRYPLFLAATKLNTASPEESLSGAQSVEQITRR